MPGCVKTNLAGKRGVAGGHGFVGAVGVRYRYTEPVCEEGEGSGRSKCASTAASDEALYKSVLCRVQEVANGVVRIVESWAPHFREELQNQREYLSRILPEMGTACHTFPIASIGVQGSFGCHKDKRDIRTTLWASLKYGGLAFPAYNHAVNLNPGDVIAFNGKDQWHANMVFPCRVDKHNYTSATEHLPAELQNAIVALYYQSQQDSYFLNAYNRVHETQVDEDGNVTDPADQLHDEDVGSDLSEYELERLARIAENRRQVIAQGGIDPSTGK